MPLSEDHFWGQALAARSLVFCSLPALLLALITHPSVPAACRWQMSCRSPAVEASPAFCPALPHLTPSLFCCFSLLSLYKRSVRRGGLGLLRRVLGLLLRSNPAGSDAKQHSDHTQLVLLLLGLSPFACQTAALPSWFRSAASLSARCSLHASLSLFASAQRIYSRCKYSEQETVPAPRPRCLCSCF